MEILENVILKPYTSMYVGGPARYFVEVRSLNEVMQAIKFAKEKNLPHFILGGGSNILVSDKGFDGLVIRVCILGKKLIKETDEYVEFEVGGGENWDNFVKFTVDRGLYGVENMSHVPGTVGASVVQNIGCYGQEVATQVLRVQVLDVNTLETSTLQNRDLHFSYRKSSLNDLQKSKGRYVVTHVIFRLQKHGELNIGYDDIRKYFNKNPSLEVNLQTIRTAIISIRDSKFPFPNSPTNGTVGSFWNADVVDGKKYDQIVNKLKSRGFEKKALEMISNKGVFTVSQGYKVPYGVLVEILSFKGKNFGNAKILDTHSCVINNFTGETTAQEVFKISEEVINAVEREFGIKMKVEPELVGDFN